jgi:hypothetical protein
MTHPFSPGPVVLRDFSGSDGEGRVTDVPHVKQLPTTGIQPVSRHIDSSPVGAHAGRPIRPEGTPLPILRPVPLPPLDDSQIAGHEAGHCLVAHLMGDTIEKVEMYKGAEGASVTPVHWPPARATLLAGVAAELALDYQVNPVRAQKDMTNAAKLPGDAEGPSAHTLIASHLDALRALQHWLIEARANHAVISGDEVHGCLQELGLSFGSERPA